MGCDLPGTEEGDRSRPLVLYPFARPETQGHMHTRSPSCPHPNRQGEWGVACPRAPGRRRGVCPYVRDPCEFGGATGVVPSRLLPLHPASFCLSTPPSVGSAVLVPGLGDRRDLCSPQRPRPFCIPAYSTIGAAFGPLMCLYCNTPFLSALLLSWQRSGPTTWLRGAHAGVLTQPNRRKYK